MSFIDTLGQNSIQPQPQSGGSFVDNLGSSNQSGTLPKPQNLLQKAGSQIGEAFSSGVQQVKQGVNQIKQGGNPIQGAEAGLGIESGLASMATSPLAPLFKPIQTGIQAVANKVSDIPAVQKFANSSAGQTTARVAQDLTNAGNVAGTIGGLEKSPEALNVAKKGVDAGTEVVKNTLAKSPEEVHSNILKDYNKAVKPTVAGKTGPGQLDAYNKNVVSAVKTMVKNKDTLSFQDENGGIETGRFPKTRGELSDAVGQTKKSIFDQYDAIAKKAGEKGAVVDLSKVGGSMNDIVNNEALKITNPSAIQYAKGIQERLTNSDGTPKTIDAPTAQEVIKNYNESLKAFYRNPTYDTASRAAIDAHVVSQIREGLDETIKNTTGENYAGLKKEYGALSSIEKDVNKSAIAQAKQTGSNTAGLGKYVDVFSGGDIVSGLLSLNPALFAKGVAQSSISHFFQWFNSPDRAVSSMFEGAHKGLSSSILDEKPTISVGLSAKDITSKLTVKDHDLMKKFIDDSRLSKSSTNKPAISTAEEADLSKMNELLGISQDLSAKSIANKYEDILSGKKPTKTLK